ncbi:MarR family transcriptional regulator [Nostoc sp. FACHB-152]|uniref:MarR family winged helix-turn-helix transcriptional regulator n=1 Tax=unclassified Nostoc TaxID=2593658 RepID=UPI001686FD3C|nr:MULTISPECIES: MarR family transcriptional regulator [unclassified Nostoc]MBD2449300.1 MarR family transcriptional regulator [Nostoc sp. FACHB-152]MBD2470532.1 MarR family transcriptional regulator [Nostoc sp. FACHB-145]
MNKDRIDIILEEWQQELPQLDTSAIGIIGRVLRIARLLEKHRESILVEYGLNVWSFDVLATLRRQGQPFRLKPTELYSLLMLSSGAMTNRIDRLEQDGIVTRVRDAEDRRSVMVQLTPKGIQLANTVMPILFEKEKQVLSQFTADELQLSIPMLRKLLMLLEQDAKSV